MVVGVGTAGLVAAHAAAALGAKVAVIERALLGGDCLNAGCVPSKAIIRTSRLYAEMRNAEQYGAHAPADMSKFAEQRSTIRDEIKSQRSRDRSALFEAGVKDTLIKQGKIKIHKDVIDRLLASYRS